MTPLAPGDASAPRTFAWGPPPGLVEHCNAGAAIELVYVHVPFGADLEASGNLPVLERCMTAITDKLGEILGQLHSPYGVARWPVDDVVAWIADSPHQSGARPGLDFDDRLCEALREAIASQDVRSPLSETLSEVTVARRCMPVRGAGGVARAYARALLEAQRGACDPIAREVQHSTDLMERALEQRAFTFHYQPIVDTARGAAIAYEALCRGTMDEFRFPDVIFSAAERTGKIWPLSRVLRDLVAESMDGFAQRPEGPPLMFINVHPADIDDPVFLEQALSGGLSRHARNIVVELTERAAIRDYRRVKEFFATLRRHGFRLAIDDLGSGYAGLTALAELEPDFIKFDMGLIRDLHLHPIKQRLIRRMHEFAIEIGAETISEGVECAAERDCLLQTGCTLMQGYFFARPAPQLANVAASKFPPMPARSGRTGRNLTG